jgi:uncharacterized protein
MVCGLFAVFWLSFGMLQLPTLGLAAPYSANGENAIAGAASKEFNAVIALYLIVWGFALFTFFIFTLKTNMVFAGIFLFVTIAAWVLSGAYWKVSTGDYKTAGDLQKVSSFPFPIPCCFPARLQMRVLQPPPSPPVGEESRSPKRSSC